MTPENMKKVVDLCNQISNITYENLTKIIRLEQTGSATGARKLDDSDQNDIDSWMGGGTCFSMTWHLYQTLTDMGFKPRLVMGHKRKERNIHCALILPDPDSNVTLEAHSADRAHNGSYRSLHSLQDDKSNLFSRSVSPASVPGSVLSSNSYLLDPGYLIFDPLQMPLPQPFGTGEAFFPLSPNCVRLVRPTLESMELWTGGAGAPILPRNDDLPGLEPP